MTQGRLCRLEAADGKDSAEGSPQRWDPPGDPVLSL